MFRSVFVLEVDDHALLFGTSCLTLPIAQGRPLRATLKGVCQRKASSFGAAELWAAETAADHLLVERLAHGGAGHDDMGDLGGVECRISSDWTHLISSEWDDAAPMTRATGYAGMWSGGMDVWWMESFIG